MSLAEAFDTIKELARLAHQHGFKVAGDRAEDALAIELMDQITGAELFNEDRPNGGI